MLSKTLTAVGQQIGEILLFLMLKESSMARFLSFEFKKMLDLLKR